MDEETRTNKKKWHQRWWGIVIFILIACILLFLFVFIEKFLILVEEQRTASYERAMEQFGLSSADTGASLRSVIETDDDPFFGNPDAEIVIVEFSDFQCPVCFQAYPEVKRFLQEYGSNVKFIYRDFPVTYNHEHALNAAMAAECADDQDLFWEYHNQVFENRQDLSLQNLKIIAGTVGLDTTQFNDCLDTEKYKFEVMNDYEDGIRLGIAGTPTFFINGISVPGVITYENFKKILINFDPSITDQTE